MISLRSLECELQSSLYICLLYSAYSLNFCFVSSIFFLLFKIIFSFNGMSVLLWLRDGVKLLCMNEAVVISRVVESPV